MVAELCFIEYRKTYVRAVEQALELTQKLRDQEKKNSDDMISGLKRSVKTWRRTAKDKHKKNKRLGKHCALLQEKLHTATIEERFKAMVDIFDKARARRENRSSK